MDSIAGRYAASPRSRWREEGRPARKPAARRHGGGWGLLHADMAPQRCSQQPIREASRKVTAISATYAKDAARL